MTISRKTFLHRLGVGAAGLGALHLGANPAGVDWPRLPDYQGASDRAYWSAVRAEYRLDEGLHYFNTGGLGPCVEAVRVAVERRSRELEKGVESGHVHYETARAEAATFLGCDPAEVAFVRNATEGNGIVAGGLELSRGDEVIFESHAHPGGSFPWLLQAKRRGIVVRVFEPDPRSAAGNVARIAELMTERTRVVQVSHVTAPTGLVMPVAEIGALCAARQVWFHVDGAQSAGMFPFRFVDLRCDSYATSGHKWLGAPRETGLLVVKRVRQDEVTPPLVGAYSGEVDSLPGELEFAPNAVRYEYGTRDVSRVVGVSAAMTWQNGVGRERIAAHARRLTAQLRQGLEALPDVEILTPAAPGLSASILTFRSSRMGFEELFGRLWRDYRLRCRPVSEQGLDAVRVSCHLFNTTEEVGRLLEAIDRVLRAA